jgi:hypothetical protein
VTKPADHTLADVLRDAVRKTGRPAYKVARAAGVAWPRVYYFMRGGNMTLRNADRLARHLGLELRPRAPEGR